MPLPYLTTVRLSPAILAALDNLFMLHANPDHLVGTRITTLQYILGFRGANRSWKQHANSVAQQANSAVRLRGKAGATLVTRIQNTDGPPDPESDEHLPFNDAEVISDPGSVFQRLHPVPSQEQIEVVARLHKLNEGHLRLLEATRHFLVTICLGPPGTGKTTALMAVADLWMKNAIPRNHVHYCTGSNTGSDQSLKGLRRQCATGGLLAGDAFPGHCYRVGHADNLDDDIRGFTTDGHYARAHGGVVPIEAGITHADLADYKATLFSGAKLIVSTHEGAADIPIDTTAAISLIDEAGQATVLLSSIPMAHAAKGEGHAVFSGDPHQLPPTVLSRNAEAMGVKVSLFQRIDESLGQQQGAVVHLTICYRSHPEILRWPSNSFYSDLLATSLTHPATDRPAPYGVPLVSWDNLDPKEITRLAQSLNQDDKDLQNDLPKIANPPAGMMGDKRRTLMVHVAAIEVHPRSADGYANIPEAATVCDLVAALEAYLLKFNKTLLIVCGYKAQNPLFLDGWPQSPGHYEATMREGSKSNRKGKGKGKGKGKSKDSGPNTSRNNSPGPSGWSPRGQSADPVDTLTQEVPTRGWERVFTQAPTDANGLKLEFWGLRRRCPELFRRKLIKMGTIDSFQGGEAHVVLFPTTRSNEQHKLGFIDCPKRVNVALSRGMELNVVIGNGAMFHNAVESKLNNLSAAAQAGHYWIRLKDAEWMGHRSHLETDDTFDPIQDLASAVECRNTPDDNVRMQVDDERKKRDRETEATRVNRSKAFDAWYNMKLDEDHDWTAFQRDLQEAITRLLMHPALPAVLYLVMSLHPHQYGLANQPLDARRYDRKIWSQMGFLYDLLIGLDAGNLVYNATWATIVYAAGLGSAWDDPSIDVPKHELPPMPDKQSYWSSFSKWVRERCIPSRMLRKVPNAWSCKTKECTRHKAQPGTEYMTPLFDDRHADGPIRSALLAPDGSGMPLPWARTVLVLMQLMIREPRACLFPFGDPGTTGDILEAVLGICSPDRVKDSKFSGDFAKNWGLTEEDLRELHTRLEDLVRLVARLVQVAHHHDIAKEAGCPKNAQEFAEAEFPFQATMKVMEAFVTPADVSAIGFDEDTCSVCALSQDLAGSTVGLGPTGTAWESRPQYMGGGKALTGKDVLHDKPLEPAPGVVLCPPSLRKGDTRFTEQKTESVFFCDFCTHPIALKAKQGTWFKQEVLELLAGLRGPAWAKGSHCRWQCGHCWFARMRREGVEVVDTSNFHLSHSAVQDTLRDRPRPPRDVSATNLAQEGNRVIHGRVLPYRVPRISAPATNTTLAVMLLNPEGPHDPKHVGHCR